MLLFLFPPRFLVPAIEEQMKLLRFYKLPRRSFLNSPFSHNRNVFEISYVRVSVFLLLFRTRFFLWIPFSFLVFSCYATFSHYSCFFTPFLSPIHGRNNGTLIPEPPGTHVARGARFYLGLGPTPRPWSESFLFEIF